MTGNYDPETNSPTGARATAGRGWAISARATTSTRRPRSPWTWPRARSRGHFQYTPNESYDWDEVSPPILVDFQRNGRTVKGLVDVARNGYLWFLERGTGPIKFVSGMPYVKHDGLPRAGPVTGRPDVVPERKPGTGKIGGLLPVALGRQELAAHRVQPADAHDLRARQREPVHVDGRAAREVQPGVGLHRRAQPCCPSRRAPTTSARCRPGTSTPARVSGRTPIPGRRTGDRCWPRAAGWCFSGGTSDRMFHAFDARTGKVLWEFPTNFRRHRPAVDVHARRPPVRRRAVGVGHRRPRDAGPAQRDQARGVSRGAGRRSGLGLRPGELTTRRYRGPAFPEARFVRNSARRPLEVPA